MSKFYSNKKTEFLTADNKLHEATEVIYEAIDNRMDELVEKTKYNCKYVILMGAILINSDTDMGSFTTIKRFDVINLTTDKRNNLLTIFNQ